MKKKKMLTLKIMSLVMLICLLTSCSNSQSKSEAKADPRESSMLQTAEVRNCRVTADNTTIKQGTGDSFPNLGSLNKGDEVKVLDQVGDWYVIQLDNNRVGCVRAQDCTPIVKEGQQQPNAQTPNLGGNTQPVPPESPQNNQPNVSEPTSDFTTLEAQMFELINNERAKNQLPPLKKDLELTRVARIKSQDMVDNNYFSHYSPNYGSPADMLNSFGIKYLQVGENIAANNSVERAHEGLMQSSGHRKNILNPNFTNIGLGIKKSDRYGYIFTQLFITKPK